MAKPRKNSFYFLLSLLYGGVTEVRNFLFDRKIIPAVQFPLPIICVGNVAVGGTGKTPHTEFLLTILGEKWKTAVLSRGYKRHTRGFVLADERTDAKQIGDEPFQIFSKFPKTIVAVDEKRVHGVRELLSRYDDIEAIVLDDAFQHRHIRAGLNILLTDYRLLFTDDHMLPYGTLRELPKNSKRADLIVVTKCPADFRTTDVSFYRKKLGLLPAQELYFSTFDYGDIYPVFKNDGTSAAISKKTTVLAVTCIEKPAPLFDYLRQRAKLVVELPFADHHEFTAADIRTIEAKYAEIQGEKLIVTTEKDAARFKSNPTISDVLKNNIYALPLEVKILNDEQEKFIKKIYDYVRKNSTNG